jgi:selenocysteine lyase/cysteine desulfurase
LKYRQNTRVGHPNFGLMTNTIFTPQEIQQFRNDTIGTKQVIHLNNAGSGLMPDMVTQAQLDHLHLESRIGGYEAAAAQAKVIQGFYEQCARLFNTQPGNIAFTASATDAYTRALSSIPFERGDIILTDRDDFVSNQIQFLSLQKRLGVQIVHIVNASIGGVDLEDLRKKLILYKPRLLSITHIPTNSGLVQPVKEIARIFKEYREQYPDTTWYILDACQSVGQMKLDVQELACDFMSVTCRKFLRGPRGTGALYIADRVLTAGLEPMFIDMRGAEWKTKDAYQQVSDAKRFEDWEFAYATVIGTKVAIEYCLKVGEDRIKDRVQYLAGYMRNNLAPYVRVLDKGPELGGLVTFHKTGTTAPAIVQYLAQKHINVVPSYRAFGLLDFDDKGVEWAVRASPHYYNTLEEIDQFVAAIVSFTKSERLKGS